MNGKMKTFCKKLIATVSALSMVLGGLLTDIGTLATQAAAEHTAWIVGDSTVSAFTDNYYYPRYGYGTQIGNYLDDTYKVENLALSGRSSRSFLTEANYTTLKDGIKTGDVLIVGFGHNDEKAGATFTDPTGDWQTEGSFAKCLYDNYVKLAQDAGAEIILCTPIVRRNTTGTFKDSELHVTADGDYPEAIRKLGADKNVPVVDLTKLTKELYDSLGASETLYLHAWLSSKESSVDNTHLNIYGAKKIAWMFANAADDTSTEFAKHITLAAGEPTKEADLKSNPDYKEVEYSGVLEKSALWEDYTAKGTGDGEDSGTTDGSDSYVFHGTVFGDVGGNVTASNFKLETDANQNMHISVANNKGKISSKSDGIAMYYYQIPAGRKFTISATATINSIDTAANQAAFGLMARDDMYIDKYDNTIKSDYVVAGSFGDGSANCFYRKDGSLKKTVALTTENVADGKSYDLSIAYNGDGFHCTFGNEPTQSGGYDFQLVSIDEDYVYVGMFVARKADITFSNIKLDVEKVPEYQFVLTSDGNGTVSASTRRTSLEEGKTVSLTATPAEGYTFKEWQVVKGGITITNNQFVMPAADVEIKAVFEEIEKNPNPGNPGDGQNTNDGGDQNTNDGGDQKPSHDGTDDGKDHGENGGIVVIGLEETYLYTGAKIVPNIGVIDYDADGGKLLAPGKDYSVSYKNNTKVGTAYVTITGKGNYAGKDINKSFQIVAANQIDEALLVNVKGAKIAKIAAVTYTGEAVYPNITVTLKGGAATEYLFDKATGTYADKDGKLLGANVAFSNNINKGTATILLTGAKDAKGKATSVKATFKINAIDLKANAAKITLDVEPGVYAVKGATPASIQVSYDGRTLKNGTDYTVKYSANKKVGTAKVVITGKGNYAKSYTGSFTVQQFDLADTKVSVVNAAAGMKAGKVKATVFDKAGNAFSASKYTVHVYKEDGTEYDKNEVLAAGAVINVKVTAKDLVNLKGETAGDIFTVGTNFSKAKASVVKGLTKSYTGEAVKLEAADLVVTMKGVAAPLELGKDYEIVAYTNNVNKGTATAVLKGIGTYSGTKSVKFKITAKTMKTNSGLGDWSDAIGLSGLLEKLFK